MPARLRARLPSARLPSARLPRVSAAVAALGLTLVTAVPLLGAASAAWAAEPVVVAAAAAPVITQQPLDQTAVEFTTVTLTATSDDPSATINWGVSLDGGASWIPSSVDDPAGTQTSYTTAATSSRDAWLYRAVFTNELGSTSTRSAKITVTPAPPMVNLQPQPETVVAGERTNLYARAWTLDNDHTMRWQVDTGSGTFVDLAGDNVTQESLAFAAAYADSGNRYRALFTSAGGTTASDAAVLTVTASMPQVSQNPQDQYQTAGSPVTFEAGGSGDPLPTVQWQRADSTGAFADIAGETNGALTVVPAIGDDHDRFRAVFTNPAGSVTGDAAVLRVWLTPVITQIHEDQTVTEGTPALFTVHATGNPAPDIRWQVSTDENATWTDLPGATDDTYSTGPTTLADSGNYYRAIVSNYADVIVTPHSVLTVTPASGPVVPVDGPVPTSGTPPIAAPVAAPVAPPGDVVDPPTVAAPGSTPPDPAGSDAPADGSALPTTGAEGSLAAAATGATMVGTGMLLALGGRRRRTS